MVINGKWYYISLHFCNIFVSGLYLMSCRKFVAIFSNINQRLPFYICHLHTVFERHSNNHPIFQKALSTQKHCSCALIKHFNYIFNVLSKFVLFYFLQWFYLFYCSHLLNLNKKGKRNVGQKMWVRDRNKLALINYYFFFIPNMNRVMKDKRPIIRISSTKEVFNRYFADFGLGLRPQYKR